MPQFHQAITRSVFRASNERASASCMVSTNQIRVRVRPVQQLMNKAEFLGWSRIRRAPHLMDAHSKFRVKWTKDQLL